MSILDKGYRYQKNDLDFTLIAKDYEIVGRIHYVQAKCNICGKKVKLHQGQWGTGTLTGCPNCLKKTKGSKESNNEKVEKSAIGVVKPIVKIQSKNNNIKEKSAVGAAKPIAKVQNESKSKPITNIMVGAIIDDCRVDSVRGTEVTMMCQKCKNRITLNKIIIQDRIRSNTHICKCYELEDANVGLIQKIGPNNDKKEQAYRELPGWIFMNSEIINNNTRYNYRCATCGQMAQFTVNDVLNKECSCANCKRIVKTKGQPVGNNDWTGFTTKCRRIESTFTNENKIKMATVRCLICGETEDLALISVIQNNIQVCDKCANRQVILSCPVCGKNHLKNNLKGLYSEGKSDIICINKNEKIPKEELVEEHNSRIRIQYIMKKYRGRYTYQDRQDSNGERAGLMKFNEGYTGTDGQFYQSCMCIEHNKFLSLTKEEQGTYTHDFCDNDRMIPYNGKRALK